MEGWDLNAVRRFVPACVYWGVASAALLAMEWAQAHGGLAELAAVLRWTVVTGLLACVGSGAAAALRAWRQRAGDVPGAEPAALAEHALAQGES